MNQMKKSNSGSRRNKAGRLLSALPVVCKLCSTCKFWGGSREIMPGGYIEIHPYSKGECQGDGFRYMEMAALACCNSWEPCSVLADDSLTQSKVPAFGSR